MLKKLSMIMCLLLLSVPFAMADSYCGDNREVLEQDQFGINLLMTGVDIEVDNHNETIWNNDERITRYGSGPDQMFDLSIVVHVDLLAIQAGVQHQEMNSLKGHMEKGETEKNATGRQVWENNLKLDTGTLMLNMSQTAIQEASINVTHKSKQCNRYDN